MKASCTMFVVALLVALPCGCGFVSISSGNSVSVSRNNGVLTVEIDGGPILAGSDKAGQENRPAPPFAKLVAQAGIDVRMDEAADSMTVEADDNLIPLVETKITGGTLEVRIASSLSTHNPIQVTIPARQLSDVGAYSSARVTAGSVRDSSVHLQAHSSGQVTVESIESESVELTASSSGKVSVGKIEAKRLSVNASSSGEVVAAGKVEEQTVDASSSGRYEGAELASRTSRVDASSSGSANVQADEEVTGGASSAGQVRYSGHPGRVSVETSSAGSASPADG